MIADGGVIVWFIVALFIGFVGVFFMLVYAAIRLVVALFKAIFGLGRVPTPAAPDRRTRVCPHPRCGNVLSGSARFCSRCGRTLPWADAQQ